MSPRELRLRERIDSLTDRISELEVALQQVRYERAYWRRKADYTTLCPDCGEPCRGARCWSCHIDHKRVTREPAHGTYNEYVNYACRCEPCRAAKSDYQRKRKVAA